MAKMTDKKPAKAEGKGQGQRRDQGEEGGGRRTTPGPTTVVVPTVRQPGVERRKNHPTRAKNGHMEVLLTQAVPHFGQPGDLVKVRPGFARNYLLPQGMATFATPHNLRIVEKHRQRLRELEEARRADLVNLAAQIAQRSITIEANANPEGHLYGSVNADQIADALRGRPLPDRRRERQDRGAAQGARPLHHQAPPRPGRLHRGQALGRPNPHRGSRHLSPEPDARQVDPQQPAVIPGRIRPGRSTGTIGPIFV